MNGIFNNVQCFGSEHGTAAPGPCEDLSEAQRQGCIQ